MEIIFNSTTRLAAAIQARKISAVEALEAHLAQIEAHNPALNAIVTLDIEGARARAQQADDALARGEVWGPLHGVPFTLKDGHSTAGMRTTAGFPPLADHIPAEDGTVAARLKAAGGVLLGKTNVPLMLGDLQSDNPIFGRTNNPWNLDRTPGGSSGGAAAALAAGMIPFEVGSDLGGSIRIPAHFCGVFGLKPTEDRVPLTGHIPDLPGRPRTMRAMASIGPLARTIEDLGLIYRLIAGPDGRDVQVPPVPVDDIPAVPLDSLRVAWAGNFPGFAIAAEVQTAIERLAGELDPVCAAVEEVLPDVDLDEQRLAAGKLIMIMSGAFQKSEKRPPATLADYLTLLHQRDQFIMAWEQFFNQWDVLLCPVAMVAAFPHWETGKPLPVDGEAVIYFMVNAHTKIFNYSGHPVVMLPYAQSRDGLPIGVQVVSKRWSESRLLGIARALAEVTGDFQRPPGY